jgi:cell fate (sporulation/competence/biofilm development) regulator YlbF (YheA/YmcA/DUF963 family)
MTTTTEETVIMQKTRELCDTIVAQPEFQALQSQVARFLNDEQAKSQYQAVVERGELLQQKQQMGAPLEDNEIAEFNKHRDVLINNPVARGFLDAQQAMQDVQKTIGQYVAKTFELGRTPTDDDMSGCCSDHGGCGCSH